MGKLEGTLIAQLSQMTIFEKIERHESAGTIQVR